MVKKDTKTMPNWLKIQHAYKSCTQDKIIKLFDKAREHDIETLSLKQIRAGFEEEFQEEKNQHALNQGVMQLCNKKRIERVERGVYRLR